MNSKVDMVHQMHTSGNLQEESFSGSWVHDILNSHRSSSGEVLNWMPNFCEQIAPEYWSTSKWELAHFTVHNCFIIFFATNHALQTSVCSEHPLFQSTWLCLPFFSEVPQMRLSSATSLESRERIYIQIYY